MVGQSHKDNLSPAIFHEFFKIILILSNIINKFDHMIIDMLSNIPHTSRPPSGGAILESTRFRVSRHFFKKKFKVDFSVSKSKSVNLILKTFDDKYSLILVICLIYLFYLIFLIRSVDLFCFISLYDM